MVSTYKKALRGFDRVSLAPGERQTVSFSLTAADLALYDRNHQWTVEPGRFTVMIGQSSESIRLHDQFTITAADGSAPEELPLKDEHLDPR